MFAATTAGVVVGFTLVVVLVGLVFIGVAIQSLGREQPHITVATAIGGGFFFLIALMMHCNYNGRTEPEPRPADQAATADPAEEPGVETEDGDDAEEAEEVGDEGEPPLVKYRRTRPIPTTAPDTG